MKHTFKTNTRNQGFTLIELLLVLAIVAALTVTAFIVYPRVTAGRAATYETQVLSGAQASTKALFASGNYNNLSNTVANQADFFPSSMEGATDADINNQWAGAVTIEPSTNAGAQSTANPAQFFRIVYESVPKEVCTRLAPAAAQNFGAVLVNNVEVVNTLDTDDTNDLVDEAAIALNCEGATGGVQMVFVSR